MAVLPSGADSCSFDAFFGATVQQELEALRQQALKHLPQLALRGRTGGLPDDVVTLRIQPGRSGDLIVLIVLHSVGRRNHGLERDIV